MIRRLIGRHGDLLAEGARTGEGSVAQAELDSLLHVAEAARHALTPVATPIDFRERLGSELQRVAEGLASGRPERLASAVEELGRHPRRFKRPWIKRYRWLVALSGSAAVALVGGLALVWRERATRAEPRPAP
jgi:hypothetical protein